MSRSTRPNAISHIVASPSHIGLRHPLATAMPCWPPSRDSAELHLVPTQSARSRGFSEATTCPATPKAADNVAITRPQRTRTLIVGFNTLRLHPAGKASFNPTFFYVVTHFWTEGERFDPPPQTQGECPGTPENAPVLLYYCTPNGGYFKAQARVVKVAGVRDRNVPQLLRSSRAAWANNSSFDKGLGLQR